jgi:predicted  nucleic acid-binding Zn-ribbon protein
MTESPSQPVLPLLIQLSRLDSRIAVVQAQLKQVQTELGSRSQTINSIAQKRESRAKILAEKKALVAREEKGVKLERDKINDRRRALGTLNNYKLQQAAEREIDFVSKQIGQREDLLLGLMREVELIEKDLSELDAGLNGLKDEFQAFENKAKEQLADLTAELSTLQSERAEQAKAIGNVQALTVYNRIVGRFPSDPIVDLVNRDSCAGCFMKVGPQVPVQISRGDVVKCPGCGRILKLSDASPAA